MNKIIKIALLFTLLISFVTLGFAQSTAEVEMAKKFARQQGYSEAQIEAMIKQQQGGGQPAKTTVQTKNVERVSAEDKSDLLKLFEQEQSVDGKKKAKKTGKDTIDIYGHDIFKNAKLNFVPSYNLPTPDSYKLSAGDEVIIDIWGNVITNITTTVTPEGAINIPDLGPVYIAGQTITSAEKSLKEYLSKIYSGISDPTPTTFVKLALGKIRSVTVNVVGDVVTPGSYTIPSLSTIASAMYLAGGPNDIGTIREIKLYRKGKLVSTFDVYELITSGKYNANARLDDDDAIVVGPYTGIVNILGAVKRPMRYEVRQGETLDKVLSYAGGFSDAAYTKKVHIDRIFSDGDKKGATAHSFDVNEEQFSTFAVENGDEITILPNEDRFFNRVKIAGAVWRPGSYSLNEKGSKVGANISTLRELLEAAGGVKEEAFLPKAYVVRFGENREKEHVSFSLTDVLLGKENVILQADDSVKIYSIHDVTEKPDVKIYGEVNRPTGSVLPVLDKTPQGQEKKLAEYEYRKGMTIGDVILMAGGTTQAASLSKVEVARRIKKDGIANENLDKNDTIAIIMHYNILTNPRDIDVKLEPFDVVFVRRSPLFKPQQAITVEGEVKYPGQYVVEKNVVRLSDIVKKAQGFNSDAYINGAKLSRKLTKEELARLKTAMAVARKQSKDTTAIDSLEMGESYNIGIDLAAAVANPGSYADVVLREGDVISVPKMNNTVKITGAVLYPNTVAFNDKCNWREYVENAGGTLQQALTKKIYMVHMNGMVAMRGSKNFKVQPGTEIVVPTKDKKVNSGQSLAAIMGIASSTASLAAMVVTIINQAK